MINDIIVFVLNGIDSMIKNFHKFEELRKSYLKHLSVSIGTKEQVDGKPDYTEENNKIFQSLLEMIDDLIKDQQTMADTETKHFVSLTERIDELGRKVRKRRKIFGII